jgi:hypothetical protein
MSASEGPARASFYSRLAELLIDSPDVEDFQALLERYLRALEGLSESGCCMWLPRVCGRVGLGGAVWVGRRVTTPGIGCGRGGW